MRWCLNALAMLSRSPSPFSTIGLAVNSNNESSKTVLCLILKYWLQIVWSFKFWLPYRFLIVLSNIYIYYVFVQFSIPLSIIQSSLSPSLILSDTNKYLLVFSGTIGFFLVILYTSLYLLKLSGINGQFWILSKTKGLFWSFLVQM